MNENAPTLDTPIIDRARILNIKRREDLLNARKDGFLLNIPNFFKAANQKGLPHYTWNRFRGETEGSLVLTLPLVLVLGVPAVMALGGVLLTTHAISGIARIIDHKRTD